MILALAGLPGSGKSTLARALARGLGVPVFDKDAVRQATFGPAFTVYQRGQDDLVVRFLVKAAADVLARGSVPFAVLDGRTFSRAGAADELRTWSDELGLEVRFVWCRCSEAEALRRLERDAGRHPAADRDAQLYQRLAVNAVVPEGALVLETEGVEPESLAERVVAWLGVDVAQRPPTP